MRELIEPLGYDGGKTIVDDYLREVRPLFKRGAHASADGLPAAARSASGICGSRRRRCRSGTARRRRAWVVVACLGYSRAGAGALVFSKEAPDVLWGMGRCLWSLGALPELMVWDREGCLHAGGGRPTDVYAGFCGRLPVDWYFCEPGDAQAKGCVERLQGYLETNFEPGRRFANELDFQLQLDAWFEKANAPHAQDAARAPDRPAGRGARGDAAAARAASPTSTAAGWSRVPPDPHLRFDTNDYSLDPNLVGRRVEVRATPARDHRGRARHAASSPAGTSAASRRTARSPRSSTPARSGSAAASPTATSSSSSARSPSTTA